MLGTTLAMGHATRPPPACPPPPGPPPGPAQRLKRTLPTVTDGVTADEVNRQFFEAQIGMQCGVHATNNAFGDIVLTVAGMALLIDQGKAWQQSGGTASRPA